MLSSLIWSPYFLVDIFWIYVSISTLSLYKKFEEESKERTNSQLTFVGTTFNHRLGQIGLQIKQNNGSSGYSQLASYQENFNLAESNQLPSYEKVCPSAPPK